jgi:hypothetical protein
MSITKRLLDAGVFAEGTPVIANGKKTHITKIVSVDRNPRRNKYRVKGLYYWLWASELELLL